MAHYEVIVYADDAHKAGQVAAITTDQDEAARVADELRESGYTGVEIKRLGKPNE